MTISDTEFLEQFENQTLAPEYFDHRGHMRLAWLYLNQYPLQTAVHKVGVGISNYANSLGATDKFHYTLTEAIVRVMAIRLERTGDCTFEEYLRINADLFTNLWGVIKEYYTEDAINSATAKSSFVEPDLKPFS